MASRIFSEEKNGVELDWLEQNLLRGGNISSVKVVFSESTFDPSVYRGKQGFERYQRVVDGSERTLGRIEFAAACGKQQILEVLFCLFVKYGSEFPHDATFDLGLSQSRLLYSDYGHYYGEWIQAKLEYQCLKSKVEKFEDMKKLLMEQELKVMQAEESRRILESYRNVYSQTEVTKLPKFLPSVPTLVGVRIEESQMLNVVRIGPPGSAGAYGPEGVLLTECELPTVVVKDDKVEELCHEQKWMMQLQRKSFDYANVQPVNPLILQLENANVNPTYQRMKLVEEGDWNLGPESLCLLRQNIVKYETVYADKMSVAESNDKRLIQVILDEDQNQQARKDEKFQMRVTTTSHFKFAWDLHAFGPLTHYNVVINVLWKDDAQGDVVRVIAANCKGQLLTDMPVSGGPGYALSLYNARRALYYCCCGASIYAFNVTQKLSRVGFVGNSDRIVDLADLPMLRGKKPGLGVDKYQLRYGRSEQALQERKDPALDTLLFSAFLMRRDGINWKHRRRRNMV